MVEDIEITPVLSVSSSIHPDLISKPREVIEELGLDKSDFKIKKYLVTGSRINGLEINPFKYLEITKK